MLAAHMTREAQKAIYEREVFERFLDASGIDIDRNSIQTGNANQREPDILFHNLSGRKIGFELGRLVDPNLISAIKQREPKNGQYIRTRDPSNAIAHKKIKKTYSVSFPVELLLYKELPIITPDNVILLAIRPVCHFKHQYHRVWYMGGSVEVLYERS
jgi:hypothetical protein